jgi:hypothetical protein
MHGAPRRPCEHIGGLVRAAREDRPEFASRPSPVPAPWCDRFA